MMKNNKNNFSPHLLAFQPSILLDVRSATPILELEGEADLRRAAGVIAGEVDQEVQGHCHEADVGDFLC